MEIQWKVSDDGNIIKKFIIPVGGLSKKEAENSLKEIMLKYNEEIVFDDKNITKDYFLPVKENIAVFEINQVIAEELEKCKDLMYFVRNYIFTKYDRSDIRYWLPAKDNLFVKEMLKDWGKEDIYGPWTKQWKEGDSFTFHKSFYLIDYDGPVPNIEIFEDRSHDQDLEYFKDKLKDSLDLSYIPKSRYDKSNLAKQDNKFTKLIKNLKFW